MMEDIIVLGHVGEVGAERIEIDLSEFREFGNGAFHLLHQRPNDIEPYEVEDIEVINGTLIWNVSEFDVEFPGIGTAEIQLRGLNFLVKSHRYLTETKMAL